MVTDRTPKNPLVFCHGLLGFDYIGPASLPPYVNAPSAMLPVQPVQRLPLLMSLAYKYPIGGGFARYSKPTEWTSSSAVCRRRRRSRIAPRFSKTSLASVTPVKRLI
jgi:hypothetical protein